MDVLRSLCFSDEVGFGSGNLSGTRRESETIFRTVIGQNSPPGKESEQSARGRKGGAYDTHKSG